MEMDKIMKTLTIGTNHLKTNYCKPYEGYAPRGTAPWKSIIIHTTNGKAGSTFDAEANFIARSKDIGAHFLVGKDGRVENIVPLTYFAYHAGRVRDLKYSNLYSIGIENHFTPSEKEWTGEMWYGLTSLMQQYLPRVEVQTHRYVAIPKGRKIDPSGVSDTAFEMWTSNLYADWKLIETITDANYRAHPEFNDNIIAEYESGKRFIGIPVGGAPHRNNATWYLTPGGYFHSSVVKVVY